MFDELQAWAAKIQFCRAEWEKVAGREPGKVTKSVLKFVPCRPDVVLLCCHGSLLHKRSTHGFSRRSKVVQVTAGLQGLLVDHECAFARCVVRCIRNCCAHP